MLKIFQKRNYSKHCRFPVLLRFLLLFFLAFFVNTLVFLEIKNLTKIHHQVKEVFNDKEEYLEQQSVNNFQENFEKISSLIKTPTELLYFNVYLENYRKIEIKSSKEIILASINTDVKGNYVHAIKYGETKKITAGILGLEMPYLPITLSIKAENGTILSTSTPPLVGSFYNIYIWPTWGSWVFLYVFVSIPLTYAFLILINACNNFVLFGLPFTDKK